jgi:HEPN domain-containing protein
MSLGRFELQHIANAKVDDARLLFENGRYSNSYYLFGFGIEIALKARIARVFQAETIPDRKFVSDIYTHDLDKLVSLAQLAGELGSARKESPQFDAYWSTASDWSEQSRYDMIDVFRATALKNAVLDPDQGIMQWLRNHW